MNDSTTLAIPADASDAALLDRTARRLILNLLAPLQDGHIRLVEPDGQTSLGDAAMPAITVRVHSPRFYRHLLFGGATGAGEAFIDGLWECDDLPALLRLLLRNRPLLNRLEGPFAAARNSINRLLHALRRNTPTRARRNIAAHYDLGNDFFQTFLDPTLCYSCGVYESDDATLHDASVAKMDRLCRKLDLRPSDHLLEIGTGWGGLALHAAQRYGCRVTTTTISREQYDFARERIERAGLADRVTLLLEDYRNLSGRYDKLVSVEMIEAVGHQFFETYFRKCSDLLAPDGLMALQAITIADQAYERYRRSVDFINLYIFPGGCLPSLTAITDSLTRATDLRLFHLEDIGPHYARTLRDWRARFFAALPDIRRLGYPDHFLRMWDYYLASCEAGFDERAISTVQLLLTKPASRRAPLIPPLQ